MLDITVRPAESLEREPLEALQRRASLNNPGDRQAMLENPEAIELPLQQILDRRVFVALQEERIAGFSVILPRDDGDAELDGLFVEPECWRQGVGRALVEHGAKSAKGEGARYLHVVGNPHAEHFYIACGFRVTGSTQTRFGTGLLMKMAL